MSSETQITVPRTPTHEAARQPIAAHDVTRSGGGVLAAIHSAPAHNRHVLQVATRYAKCIDAPLTVLSVIETTTLFPNSTAPNNLIGIASSITSPPSPAVLEGVTECVSAALTQVDPDYGPGRSHPRSAVRVTLGDPEYEIASLALSTDAALLVIGRGDIRGRGRVLNALLNGIRSIRVCRAVGIPVVAVAPAVDGNDPLGTIVIATDESPASWTAAVTAVHAAPLGAHVHVVHVVSEDERCDQQRRALAEATLAAWFAPLTAMLPAAATLTVSILIGDSFHALEAYLSAVGATCVAVGGHRPRPNMISVLGHTVPERLLATWSGSIILGPYHESATP